MKKKGNIQQIRDWLRKKTEMTESTPEERKANPVNVKTGVDTIRDYKRKQKKMLDELQ